MFSGMFMDSHVRGHFWISQRQFSVTLTALLYFQLKYFPDIRWPWNSRGMLRCICGTPRTGQTDSSCCVFQSWCSLDVKLTGELRGLKNNMGNILILFMFWGISASGLDQFSGLHFITGMGTLGLTFTGADIKTTNNGKQKEEQASVVLYCVHLQISWPSH